MVHRWAASRVKAGRQGSARSSEGSQEEQDAVEDGRRLRSRSSSSARPPAAKSADQPSWPTEPL